MFFFPRKKNSSIDCTIKINWLDASIYDMLRNIKPVVLKLQGGFGQYADATSSFQKLAECTQMSPKAALKSIEQSEF